MFFFSLNPMHVPVHAVNERCSLKLNFYICALAHLQRKYWLICFTFKIYIHVTNLNHTFKATMCFHTVQLYTMSGFLVLKTTSDIS